MAFAQVLHSTSARTARCSAASRDPATGPGDIGGQNESPSAHGRCRASASCHDCVGTAWLALPVLATAARTKSLSKLNDGLAAANLLTHHARCCSDKKSFTGLHDIASTVRVWQWFSRCECCTCSVCLSSELIESAKQSYMSIVTKSQVHRSAKFGMSVHCPHNSKVSVSAASYRCHSRNHPP